MSGRRVTESWKQASSRADRILVAVAIMLVALAGSVFGAGVAHSPVAGRTIHLLRTVVEYVRLPEPPAPASASADSDRQAGTKLLAQHRCLAEALYYEARGEGEQGQKAVAEVVFHRLQSGGYGRSICAVVYAGASRPSCQFSFACDGSLARKKSAPDWRKAEMLAARILAGEESLEDVTDDAVNYHATYVRPYWAASLVRTARIGNHIFYRPEGTRPEFASAVFRKISR